jgi:hypothetical protein
VSWVRLNTVKLSSPIRLLHNTMPRSSSSEYGSGGNVPNTATASSRIRGAASSVRGGDHDQPGEEVVGGGEVGAYLVDRP